jgi:hypothetical protein
VRQRSFPSFHSACRTSLTICGAVLRHLSAAWPAKLTRAGRRAHIIAILLQDVVSPLVPPHTPVDVAGAALRALIAPTTHARHVIVSQQAVDR